MAWSLLPLRLAGLACGLFAGMAVCIQDAAAAGMSIRSGHAGHWYAADRSGEGWVLELREGGGAWLYWFTYDEQGRQRWLTAAGQIVADGDDGQRIDFPQLVVTRGARFGAAFDPADVIREAVGSASLRFDGCDSGQFSYSAFDQSQTFDVQRLARVMGTRCETPHGVTGREVASHAGQSGSWYDPAHNGEGYALHWATPDQAIVTWYSYDGQGNQYWMLGTGRLGNQGRVHFADVHATRGARFGAAFDPDDVERFAWGELTFDLACEGGSAQYQSVLPAFGSGDFDLTRLTSLREVACPWQPPKLTDLYDIQSVRLPPLGGDGEYGWERVVDGGRTFGAYMDRSHGLRLDTWQPGDDSATVVPDGWPPASVPYRNDLMLFSADGSVRVVNMSVMSGGLPLRWTETDGWRSLGDELPSSDGVRAEATALSADGRYIAGQFYSAPGSLPGRDVWRWSQDTGLDLFSRVTFPGDSQPLSPRVETVSNTGIVAGRANRDFNTGIARYPTAFHLVGDTTIDLLSGSGGDVLGWVTAGNAIGTVMFGDGLGNRYPNVADPRTRTAWYRLASGGHAPLPWPEIAGVNHSDLRCRVSSASADGSLAVGVCSPSPGRGSGWPYIWSQHTGTRSLLPLVPGLHSMLTNVRASVASDGRHVLLSWMQRESPRLYGAHLFTLQPKDPEFR